jgi:hypothetical protein
VSVGAVLVGSGLDVPVVPEVGGGVAVMDVSVLIETPDVFVIAVEEVSVATALVSVLFAAVSLLHATAPATHMISKTPSILRIYSSDLMVLFRSVFDG